MDVSNQFLSSTLCLNHSLFQLTYVFMYCFCFVDAEFTLTHVDEVIDELLTQDYSCDIALPRIKKRWVLHNQFLVS